MKEISIVIPVFNEEDNVAALHAEIKEVCEANKYTYEIILIDDGSTDGTFTAAKNLHPVKYLRFRRNFGQTAAMDAGIKAAKYNYIITMDGDRQNDPNDLPVLIQCLEENDFDVVSGWRKNRHDPFMKRFVSRGANKLRKIILNDNIHDSGCSLKIYRKACFDNVNLYGEMHRFIPAILEMKGYIVGEVVVNHRERTSGKTKYNWRRTVKGFLDMLYLRFWDRYSVRPLHLLGSIGLIFVLLSLISGIASVVLYILGSGMSETALPVLTSFLFLGGIQLFISGLLADIMLKNYFETSGDTSYNIKEVVEN